MKQNNDSIGGTRNWDTTGQVVPYGTILRHLPTTDRRATMTQGFGRGPKISDILRSELRNFNKKSTDGQLLISDERAIQVKSDLKKLLGIPAEYEIHLFSGNDGSALVAERETSVQGEVQSTTDRTVVRGFIRCKGHAGLLEQIPFSYDITQRQMHCDGVEVPVGGVASMLHAITIEATHGAALGEVLRRAHVRAHKPLLKGTFGDRIVVLTSAGDCLFGFIGVRWKMMPLWISPTSLTSTDLGVLIEGMSCDGASVTIFMPTADAIGRSIKTSVNGFELTTEEFCLNGHSATALDQIEIG